MSITKVVLRHTPACPKGMFSMYSLACEAPQAIFRRKNTKNASVRSSIFRELEKRLARSRRFEVMDERAYALSSLDVVLGYMLMPGTTVRVDQREVDANAGFVLATVPRKYQCALTPCEGDEVNVGSASKANESKEEEVEQIVNDDKGSSEDVEDSAGSHVSETEGVNSSLQTSASVSEDTGEARKQPMNCRQVFDAIRRVQDGPHKGYGSVLDLIKLVTGSDNKNASKILTRLQNKTENEHSPERGIHISLDFPRSSSFPGSGHQPTPVAPFNKLVKIIPHIRSRSADVFKDEIANDFVRKFAGDQTLHTEIDANNTTFTREEREDLVRGVANASSDGIHQDHQESLASSSAAPGYESLTRFCGKTCARDADLSQLIPVPGLSSDLPPLDYMKRHGNYMFVLGMLVWRSTTILVIKPGASFHGVEGMHGRYTPAIQEFPNLSVMFMDKSSAIEAREGESTMKHSLSMLGNAFQVRGTEKWLVTVAAGMHPADAARTLSDRLFESLPRARLDPASGPVPDEVARAFRMATASVGVDGMGGVKGEMWADETGHHYCVESLRVKNDLEKHKVDIQAEGAKEKIRSDRLEQLLRDGVITKEEFFAQCTS